MLRPALRHRRWRPNSLRRDSRLRGPKMASIGRSLWLFWRHGTRPRRLFSRGTRPRPPLRRPVFRRQSPPPTSIAAPSARSRPAEARAICGFIRARPPRRAPDSGPACAAGRSARPGLAIRRCRRAGWSARPSPASKSMRCRARRVGDLAASLGVSDRHLRRVTEAELGVSPDRACADAAAAARQAAARRDLAQA